MQNFINKSGIYKCTCLVNNRCYIGQAQDLARRKRVHMHELENDKHINSYLQRAWNKYGKDNFAWEVLELCPIDLLNEREIYWIEKYNAFIDGFNMTIGGGGTRGYKQTSETRMQRRQSMLGEKNPMYGRTGSLNPAYGQDHSGENNPMYGKNHTEEANEKNRQAHLGKNNVESKAVVCIETNEFFWSMGEAGRNKNCDDTTICKCCKGIKKTAGGYHWRYATQEEIEKYNKEYNIAS